MDVTQEQFNELVRQAVEKITASGEEPTPEAIQAAVEEVVAPLMKADEPVEEEKGADELMDAIVAALGNYVSVGDPEDKACADRKADEEPEQKAAPVDMEQKSYAPAERKYSALFMSREATNPGHGETFKSRLSSMTPAEKSRTVYGMFGRSIKCLGTDNDPERAAWNAEHRFNDLEMARELKAMSVTVPEDGGYLIPEVYSDEVIELLYPQTVLYSMGARRVPMENGSLNMAKQTAGVRAHFIGENRAAKVSKPKFGNVHMSAKKMVSETAISEELFESTKFDTSIMVGQDVTRKMALGIDWGGFFGSGSEFQPTGLYSNKGIRKIATASLAAEYQKSGAITELVPNYLAAQVVKNNVSGDTLGWVMNTQMEHYLKNLRDNVGGFIFAEEMNTQHKLAGYPYAVSNQILPDSNGETEIIFGNWSDLMIGETGTLTTKTYDQATWRDEDGNIHSCAEEGNYLVRARQYIDTAVRHDESFVILTGAVVPM